MAKVELKAPVIEEISGRIKDAKAAVLVDAIGLTVEQDTRLRRQLREAGVSYKVYKNTMLKRAFEGTDFEKLDQLLEGPSALAVATDDVTAPARVIVKFAKEADKLEVKGGVIEGEYYDADSIKQLASIPSREELLSKFLGSIQSPVANFARVINQIAQKKEEGGDAAAEAPAEAPAEEAKTEAPAEAPAEEAKAEAPAEEAKAEAPAAEEKPAE
ncbi:MAG: 50S ribosomal protein L10 [Lachnospiraceae bacterium]|nr:50S ribosomal protein L10 [Lachnospiraceae bacterium]